MKTVTLIRRGHPLLKELSTEFELGNSNIPQWLDGGYIVVEPHKLTAIIDDIIMSIDDIGSYANVSDVTTWRCTTKKGCAVMITFDKCFNKRPTVGMAVGDGDDYIINNNAPNSYPW